jgi:hypothetical protein
MSRKHRTAERYSRGYVTLSPTSIFLVCAMFAVHNVDRTDCLDLPIVLYDGQGGFGNLLTVCTRRSVISLDYRECPECRLQFSTFSVYDSYIGVPRVVGTYPTSATPSYMLYDG